MWNPPLGSSTAKTASAITDDLIGAKALTVGLGLPLSHSVGIITGMDESVAPVAVSPEERLWRTQLFVETDVSADGTFEVSLPAWQCDDLVEIRMVDVPLAVRASIKKGVRGYARANVGTDEVVKLRIVDWEIGSFR